MDRIATGSATDRRDLFSETASRLGMNPAIVEKDFWVCWILKHLFAEPALKGQMVFKGGTSLSKVFGLIDRFSEDIDLILDWRLLGYGHAEGNDPYQTIQSKTKRSHYNQEMNAKAAEYIRGTLLGQLNRLFALVPGIAASIDEAEPPPVLKLSASTALRLNGVRHRSGRSIPGRAPSTTLFVLSPCTS